MLHTVCLSVCLSICLDLCVDDRVTGCPSSVLRRACLYVMIILLPPSVTLTACLVIITAVHYEAKMTVVFDKADRVEFESGGKTGNGSSFVRHFDQKTSENRRKSVRIARV